MRPTSPASSRIGSRETQAFLGALFALGLAACGGGDGTPLPPVEQAQAPIARLWLPEFGAPSTPLAFDASDSQSPGGELAHYEFDYGDGSASVDSGTPMGTHLYTAEGVYAVSLTVTDLAGNSAQVSTELTVRVDPPVCASDTDCDTAQRCVNSACWFEVGSAGATP